MRRLLEMTLVAAMAVTPLAAEAAGAPSNPRAEALVTELMKDYLLTEGELEVARFGWTGLSGIAGRKPGAALKPGGIAGMVARPVGALGSMAGGDLEVIAALVTAGGVAAGPDGVVAGAITAGIGSFRTTLTARDFPETADQAQALFDEVAGAELRASAPTAKQALKMYEVQGVRYWGTRFRVRDPRRPRRWLTKALWVADRPEDGEPRVRVAAACATPLFSVFVPWFFK